MFFFVILPYASLCHTFFKENDPLRFGSYPLSVLTLFAVSTFENWGVIYNINYGGCDSYNSEYLLLPANATATIETVFGIFHTPVCGNPKAQPIIATVIFISFIFICAYFVVNMSLAAVAIGFQEKLELLGLDEKEASTSTAATPGSKSNLNTPSSPPVTGDGDKKRKKNIVSKAAKLTGADKIHSKVKRLLQVIWGEISDDAFRNISHADLNVLHAKSLTKLSE